MGDAEAFRRERSARAARTILKKDEAPFLKEIIVENVGNDG